MVVPIIENSQNNLNERVASPSAPPFEVVHHGDIQLNNEKYVHFLIEQNKSSFVVKADKQAILESNSELTKLVNGSARKIDGQIVITDVNKDIFQWLVLYLETKCIVFENTQHALGLLDLASRYTIPDLVITCVKFLDTNLSINNVIEVFRALWYYNSIIPPRKSLETKKKKTQEPPLITPEEYIAALLFNCLQFIDMNAHIILASSNMLGFRFEELEVIVKRDTLQIDSEIVLTDLLTKWSFKECERKGLDITTENRRRVLGALVYSPRYLTLSARDFDQIQNRLDLLDGDETNLIRGEFKRQNKLSSLTEDQKVLLNNFRESRPIYANMPIHLSVRSNPKNYPKRMRKYEKNKDKRRCESTLVNCCCILACIFE